MRDATRRSVHGSPEDWFGAAGWKVTGAENGSDWVDVSRALAEGVHGPNPDKVPVCVWGKTLKGRGYAYTGYKSHGAPAPINGEGYWNIRSEFAQKYGIDFEGQGQPAPEDKDALREQVATNLQRALSLFEKDPALLDYLADRLVEIGDTVPETLPDVKFDAAATPFEDAEFWDFRNYPESMWAKPGDKKPNRAGLSSWGAYVNTLGRKKYGRPLFLAMSADLADSTNISGFAKDFGDEKGWGWFERTENRDGALLPQQITEFANSGISVGIACVNVHPEALREVQRLLLGVLHLRLVQLPQVRPHAAVQPGGPGLGDPGREDAVGGRSLRPPRPPRTRAPTSASSRRV